MTKWYRVTINELGYEDLFEAENEDEAKEYAIDHCMTYLSDYVTVDAEEDTYKNENN